MKTSYFILITLVFELIFIFINYNFWLKRDKMAKLGENKKT